MADRYPTYSRQYQQRTDQYTLAPGSATSGVMYTPQQLLTQPSIVDDHPAPTQAPAPPQHDASSQSPSSQNASPKQDSPISSKPDAIPQQPSKPQATFLTKLYAYVLFSRSRCARRV